MNLGSVTVDATQWVGVAGFGAGALLCAHVARNSFTGWWVLSAINALLVFEIVAGWRYRVHDLADAFLLSRGWYESRSPWQMAMIAVAALMLLAAGYAARARIHSNAYVSAVMAVCFAVGIFVIEAISLHAIDALLYRPVGPVLVIAFFWLAVSTWISFSALMAARR
jgi:hypothetical protein